MSKKEGDEEKTVWFEKYEVIRELGEGATSKVYLALHLVLNQYRAIKCIKKHSVSYEQVRKEADLLIQLKSPYIPIVYDIEENEEFLFIIEEYIEGESLLSYRKRSRRLEENIIIELGMQICELIHYLHSKEYPILYLDLKPSNLMISNQQIKMIDFGAARYKNFQEGEKNFGTRGFAAPEQYTHEVLDEKCDIYGIGMLLYFLMTGLPYIKKDKEILREYGYSKDLCKLVRKGIKHNSCERYDSVATFSKRLLKIREQNKRKNGMVKASRKIALVGASEHVGVTHLSFYILSYLKRQGFQAIYIENNYKNIVQYFGGKNCGSEDFIKYRGYRLARAEWLEEEYSKEYDCIIYDYGLLTESNKEAFLLADIRIVVMGGAIWELSTSAKTIAMLRANPDVRYVVNHLGAREFYHLADQMSGLRVIRMPFEYDAFSTSNKNVEEFVQMLLE